MIDSSRSGPGERDIKEAMKRYSPARQKSQW